MFMGQACVRGVGRRARPRPCAPSLSLARCLEAPGGRTVVWWMEPQLEGCFLIFLLGTLRIFQNGQPWLHKQSALNVG